MDAERRWGDPLDVKDGCGELNFQRSDRHGRSMFKIASSDPKVKLIEDKTTFPNASTFKIASSDPKVKLIEDKTTFPNASTFKIASSDRTVKLLDEETTFPNISRHRQQCLKNSFFNTCFLFKKSYIPKPYAPFPEEEIEIGKQYLDIEYPIYSHAFKHASIVLVGQQLNVLDLLGDKLSCFYSTTTQNIPNPSIQPNNKSRSYVVSTALNLMGKYVMICCMFAPSIWSSADARMIYSTSLASHELARRGDFVLVVVPMMRNGFTHSFSAYEHFLSGFSCLAVPFGEYLRRGYICSALGFGGQPKTLILDPSQRVLYHGKPGMFQWVGGAEGGAFPFTPDRVEAYLTCERRWHDHYSLNELLGLRDTDVLYNIGYYHAGGDRLEEDGRRGITISELKKKFVGIYVCISGSNLIKLEEVYKECCKRGKERELEIVVVGVPFGWQEPPQFQEKYIIEALESVKLLGWWFLPFNNTVSHRLSRMLSDSQEEGLFMVDPVRKYVDVYGFPVMYDFGGVNAYPFNRKNLIEKEFQRKMGLRLKSLLLPCLEQHAIIRLNNMVDEEVPLAQVLEKKPFVVLYMYKGGNVFGKNPKEWQDIEFGDKLGAWYKNEIKGKQQQHSPNVVVVTVSLDGIDGDTNWFLEMGWLVCPADPSKSAKIREEYFFHPQCKPHEVVVAFGEDGRIQSLDASHIMECGGPPFHANNLSVEIAKEFYVAGYNYMLRPFFPDLLLGSPTMMHPDAAGKRDN